MATELKEELHLAELSEEHAILKPHQIKIELEPIDNYENQEESVFTHEVKLELKDFGENSRYQRVQSLENEEISVEIKRENICNSEFADHVSRPETSYDLRQGYENEKNVNSFEVKLEPSTSEEYQSQNFLQSCEEDNDKFLANINSQMGSTNHYMNLHSTSFYTDSIKRQIASIFPLVPLDPYVMAPPMPKERTKKRVRTNKDIKKGPFTCNVCGKIFTQKCRLNEHNISHSKIKPFVCDVCDKSFATSRQLRRHKLTHTKSKIFSCDICHKVFSMKRELITHLHIHDNVKPYKCDVCFKGFTRSKGLYEHKLTVHTDKKPYYCDVCGKSFGRKSNYNEHKNIHILRPHMCIVCNKSFKTSSVLRLHSLVHTKRIFTCDLCGKTCNEKKYLISHIKTHYNIKPYVCDRCQKSFTRLNSLNRHRLSVHIGEKHFFSSIRDKQFSRDTGEKNFACDTGDKWITSDTEGKQFSCDTENKVISSDTVDKKTFCSKIKLLPLHSEDKQFSHDIGDKQISSGTEQKLFPSNFADKQLPCDTVDVQFSNDVCENTPKTLRAQNKTSISRNQNNSNKRRLFYCDVCGKAFSLRSVLASHINSHCDYKPFKCLCDESFSTLDDLLQHKLTHDKNTYSAIYAEVLKQGANLNSDKNNGHKNSSDLKCKTEIFSCDICTKIFNEKRFLITHINTHYNIKPFTCDICNKGFTRSTGLKQHKISLHTGERPFPCEICGKAFSKKIYLNFHKNTHDNLGQFKCGVCGKSFPRGNSLRRHNMIHTGERPFPCDVCGKSFGQKSTLNRHRLTHGYKILGV